MSCGQKAKTRQWGKGDNLVGLDGSAFPSSAGNAAIRTIRVKLMALARPPYLSVGQ
jgi:hypothetical protein